tara:strand:+ start:1550 stop:2143 length:594 start_codon:yes stop_codon:yes gene_type:complete
MLNKIKTLVKTDEVVKEINEKIESTSSQVSNLKNTIEDLNSTVTNLNLEIKEMKNANESLMKSSKMSVEASHNALNDLRKEIYDFKLLKSQLQNKVLQKFEEELSTHLTINSDKLKDDLNNYTEIRNNTTNMLETFLAIKTDVTRLKAISEGIKAEDFELHRFANQLKAADNEKLTLMRRIEKLEMLISRERRNSRV